MILSEFILFFHESLCFDQDKRITNDAELSDSEDEGEAGRRDNRSYRTPQQRKRPRLDKEVTQLKDEIKCKNHFHI